MSELSETTEPSKRLDLVALDRAMSPLRRVVRYAMLSESTRGSAKYLGAIGARWAHTAGLSSGGQLSDDFELLLSMLAAYDGLVGEEAQECLSTIAGCVSAVDRVFGLPLPEPKQSRRQRSRGKGSRHKPGAASTKPGKQSKASTKAGKPTSKAGKSSRSRKRAPAVPAAAPTPTPEVTWTSDRLVGQAIADLQGAAPHVAALEAIAVRNAAELLCMPTSGESVLSPILGAGRLRENGMAAVGGRVKFRFDRIGAGSRSTVVRLQGSGITDAIWEGGACQWLIEQLAPGQRTVLAGDVRLVEGGEAQLLTPELAADDGKHVARLATYEVSGVSDRDVRGLVLQAIVGARGLQDPLPAALLAEHQLLGLHDALERYHRHGSRAQAAVHRLKFDEALLAQLAMLWPRFGSNQDRGVPHALLHGQAARFLQLVEDELSDDQVRALESIKRDLRSSTPMRRVLTGEVGAGKGLVAVLSSVVVAENKSQAMVLTPDFATAEQRFTFTQPILRELGLVAKLYSDSPSKAQRDALRRGEVHVLFGPTSLLSANLEFRRLGLVVAGERDTFGRVGQLHSKLRGPHPDLLVVTSTPVPFQVLLAAYPTFDFTVLRNGFARKVPCTVVEAGQREVAYQAAAEAVERGEQVAVVFPMRDGVDVLDAREAMRVVTALESRLLSGARIRLFHGSMSMDERNRVYDDFRRHRADVLVATSHFEGGPPIDGVSTVIIEQADRMMPSRLHRVRGHICGGRFEPKVFLVTGQQPDPKGVELVSRIARSKDGFSVSAQELLDRGLEGMVIDGMAGGPTLQLTHPVSDLDLLVAARAAARTLLENDPGLRRGGNLGLARYLQSRWSSFVQGPCPIQAGSSSGRRRRRRKKR